MSRRDPNHRCTCCNKALTNTEQRTMLCFDCTPPPPPTERERHIATMYGDPTHEEVKQAVLFLLENQS